MQVIDLPQKNGVRWTSVNALERCCWKLNPRPHLTPCGSQGIGAKSVRFFPLHTTRHDTGSALCRSPCALLPKVEPSGHVAAGYLQHLETPQTLLGQSKIAHPSSASSWASQTPI
ncbi:hypothetical protein [Comamonas thiooxydans]|uniref:hypothetical protein n=1 Tax=Comamonas thiooxydans TaxID=363952 RepID=UPI00103B3086|nr:hypothetical protein [Comamonas thiooxydans]